MLLSPVLAEPLTNLIPLLLFIAALCVAWIVLHFAFKLTIKIFTIGCLGILASGAVCGLVMWLGGR